MRKKKYFQLSKYITPIFQTPDHTGSWFGYYNYDTLNYNQTKILSHRTKNDAQPIQNGMTVELGYYDVSSGDWHPFGISDSYSWQQGSMLQWMPGKGNESKVIYNLSCHNRLVSCIQDLETGEKKLINWPIYCITPDGKRSISLEMERSYWCRAYHYESVANKDMEGRVYENDGIFEIDLENNTRKRIITIQDVISIDYELYFESAKHWLEHIMISPNGEKFCFLHRFTIGSLDEYETRLFIANIDGSGLQIIQGWRDYYWSHFGWNGDKAFTIYSYKSKKHDYVINKYKTQLSPNVLLGTERKKNQFSIKKIKKIIGLFVPSSLKQSIYNFTHKKSSFYQYYQIEDDSIMLKEEFGDKIFAIDGHPSFSKDGKYMITDSYPDGRQYQRIIVYNILTKKYLLLGRIYAGLFNKPGSCDLHPKLCCNNDFIAVDSAYDGEHHMILFKLNWKEIVKILN